MASLLVPGIASASTAAGAETRVRGYDLQEQVGVGVEGSLTLELRWGCELADYDSASDPLLVTREQTTEARAHAAKRLRAVQRYSSAVQDYGQAWHFTNVALTTVLARLERADRTLVYDLEQGLDDIEFARAVSDSLSRVLEAGEYAMMLQPGGAGGKAAKVAGSGGRLKRALTWGRNLFKTKKTSTAAKGGTKLLGPGTKIGAKIEKQMAKRGWNSSAIEKLIGNPAKTRAVRDARHLPGGGQLDDPATAYINRQGHYVIRNDRTGDIVQVSDRHNLDWVAPWD